MPIEENYPVQLTVERPERFDRVHVFLRLAILVAISLLAAFAWLVGLIYFAFPIVAAAFVSSDGADQFREKNAPKLRRWIHWIVAFDSYFTLLTDRIPTQEPEDTAKFEVQYSGEPSTGSALLRLLKSIPSAFVLALLSVAAIVTAIIAGVMILINEKYPDSLYRFHLGVVRWGARLLAYHASLVDEYPPFSLDTEPRAPSPRTDASSAPTSA